MKMDEVERVARRICDSLELDPDEMVAHGFGADFTPSERDHLGSAVPGHAINSPRWRLYRGEAASVIAAFKVMSDAS